MESALGLAPLEDKKRFTGHLTLLSVPGRGPMLTVHTPIQDADRSHRAATRLRGGSFPRNAPPPAHTRTCPGQSLPDGTCSMLCSLQRRPSDASLGMWPVNLHHPRDSLCERTGIVLPSCGKTGNNLKARNSGHLKQLMVHPSKGTFCSH